MAFDFRRGIPARVAHAQLVAVVELESEVDVFVGRSTGWNHVEIPGHLDLDREHGLIADVVPERFVAEGLVEALADVPVSRALIARAAEARDVLPNALRRRGAEVDVLALYETVPERLTPEQLAAVSRADYITFTSSSTVTYFLHSAGDAAIGDARLLSIGPVTSATYSSGEMPSGTTCAPRNVVSSVNWPATARLRASSWTVSP